MDNFIGGLLAAFGALLAISIIMASAFHGIGGFGH
jgi:hypothetical protein